MKFYDKKGMIHNSKIAVIVTNILYGIKPNKSKGDVSNRCIIQDNIIDIDSYKEYDK